MTEQPKVSVVIPIYNKGASLRRALESVVHQTLKGIEIICVDDGSIDDSRAIIDEYAERDTRIVKIYHKTNLGTSLARKNGVAASRGEYVMFLDGDDAFRLNACEVACDAAKNANVDIVHFDTHVIDLAFMQHDTSYQLDIIMHHVPGYPVSSGNPVVMPDGGLSVYLNIIYPGTQVFVKVSCPDLYGFILLEPARR